MNTRIRWFVLFLLVFLLPLACAADTIASYDMIWQAINGSTNSSSCALDLYVWENGNSSSHILNAVIDNSSTGLTLTATAGDSGFSNFVNYITNGTNGWLTADLRGLPNNIDLSCGFQESEVFGKSSSPFDLKGGAQIGSISLKINNFDLGSSPTLKETDVTCNFTFSVNTVPEPNTIAILLVIGLPLFWRFCREIRICRGK